MSRKKKAPTKAYVSTNTIKQYITLGSTDYWHLQYPLNRDWETYFWDMSDKARLCRLDRDDKGITTYYGEDGQTYYSMIETGQYAMASYQMYLQTKEQYWKDECAQHLDFIRGQIQPFRQATHALLNQYPHALYNLRGTWPSALAYGIIISALLRYGEVFSDPTAIEDAKALAENYLLDVENGGVRRSIDEWNLTLLEEYPKEGETTGVLNGHITALWSLYDLGRYEAQYRKLYDSWATELATNIHLWVGKYWSYYDILAACGKRKNLASIHYHMLHIRQLMILYRQSGHIQFAETAERFIRDKYSLTSRIRAFTGKVTMRLLG